MSARNSVPRSASTSVWVRSVMVNINELIPISECMAWVVVGDDGVGGGVQQGEHSIAR